VEAKVIQQTQRGVVANEERVGSILYLDPIDPTCADLASGAFRCF
jgi:hypothetical protein